MTINRVFRLWENTLKIQKYPDGIQTRTLYVKNPVAQMYLNQKNHKHAHTQTNQLQFVQKVASNIVFL